MLAAGGYVAFAPVAREVRVATVDTGDLAVHFVASGEVMTRRSTIAPPDWGSIRALLVKEDQKVRAGQLLVRFDAAGIRARTYAMRAAFDAARHRVLETNSQRGLRVAQIEGDIERARAEERQARARYEDAVGAPLADEQRKAEANLAAVSAEADRSRLERVRLERLYRGGAISRDLLDRARATERSARARQAEAEAHRRIVQAGPSARRIAISRADLERARLGVDLARRQLGELPILDVRSRAAMDDMRTKSRELRDGEEALDSADMRAPFDGVISHVLLHQGDRANGGQPILTLVSTARPWIEASVDEQDSSRVSLGQQVSVRVGALPGKVFPGTVARMAPALEAPPGAPGNARFLRIRVELKQKDSDLRAGMAAEVEGQVTLARRALLLPRSAVVQSSSGSFVMGIHGGRVIRVPVRLGATTADVVQVLAGPGAGMQVVVEGADRLSEGMAVRPAP